ncbi:S1C family serine protease [Intrasporangium flavum]|uniref:S1C family serine protease n=1 Tax=Intrasporangium flavum TaxID=1428657 RepID=UPI00096EB238|nr:trypsin-like peptidase domain-containing protein [Intrasporangium flavum]
MARVTDPPKVHPAGPLGAAPPASTPGLAPPRPPGSSQAEPPSEPPSVPPRRFARLRGLPRRVWVTVLVVLLVAGGGLAFALTRPPGPPALTQRDVDASVRRGLEAYSEQQAAEPADATLAHRAIEPSLVVVSTRTTTSTGTEEGTGAGVVVNEAGTVLTADHVVAGAGSITVQFADGTSSPARVLTHQPEIDIATLVPTQLPDTVVPAVLGGGVQVGAPVFAVGHPLGLTDSLSAGVVSALERTVTVPDGRRLQHLIQFDAAVNPGNSGGPLLDRSGHVVGIVTGLANPTDQALFVGIGFAVPIATAGGAAGSPPH